MQSPGIRTNRTRITRGAPQTGYCEAWPWTGYGSPGRKASSSDSLRRSRRAYLSSTALPGEAQIARTAQYPRPAPRKPSGSACADLDLIRVQSPVGHSAFDIQADPDRAGASIQPAPHRPGALAPARRPAESPRPPADRTPPTGAAPRTMRSATHSSSPRSARPRAAGQPCRVKVAPSRSGPA